ncbi:MAG: 4-hydroxythreonine-4-phosphate dehydrogenase PdxA [Hyphomicrobiaceae bacterium]|nr:4-hydroxythreonine-4-phosphate dehydrogenase PdxA [Hyphomicrobiaceae bacterium]
MSLLRSPGSGVAPLAVTMGDPAGIGPDITLAAWLTRGSEGIAPFALYADPDLMESRARGLGLDVPVTRIDSLSEAPAVFAKALPVVPVGLTAHVVAGRPDPANAAGVLRSIEMATAAVATGQAAALVTNPIAKSVLYRAGFTHPGHTEYLAELALRHFPGMPRHPVMLLAADDLRVVPVTIHIPLSEVARTLTAGLIERTIRIAASDLERWFGLQRPRIAVAGLNPHAGEGGAIGREEVEIIGPALATLRAEGFQLLGPYSADTMFHAAARSHYDLAVAMYHDQALIPLKTLAFDRGVNITLGLPFARTSPDHGTAFDLAGTGRASARSLIAALRLAETMAQCERVRRGPG